MKVVNLRCDRSSTKKALRRSRSSGCDMSFGIEGNSEVACKTGERAGSERVQYRA